MKATDIMALIGIGDVVAVTVTNGETGSVFVTGLGILADQSGNCLKITPYIDEEINNQYGSPLRATLIVDADTLAMLMLIKPKSEDGRESNSKAENTESPEKS